MEDLDGYSEQVKQAFNLNNGADDEIYKAKNRRIIDIFSTHSLDVGNQAIQAAIQCEQTISLLDHLRKHHKDVSALIRLERLLVDRRKSLMYLKCKNYLAYHHILRLYNIEDVERI